MKNSPLLVVAAVLALAGCANRPSSIAASYVSHERFSHLNCDELSAKRQITAAELTRASAKQNNVASGDAVGVFLLGVPFSKLSGDHEAEVAQLKGEMQAVETAQAKAKCPMVASNAGSGLPYATAKMQDAWAEYAAKPYSKAFAISTNGRGGYGRAWSNRSVREAQEAAIAFCEAQNPKGSCFVYAVNDEVVWKAPY